MLGVAARLQIAAHPLRLRRPRTRVAARTRTTDARPTTSLSAANAPNALDGLGWPPSTPLSEAQAHARRSRGRPATSRRLQRPPRRSRSGTPPSPLDAGVMRANQAPIVGLPEVLESDTIVGKRVRVLGWCSSAPGLLAGRRSGAWFLGTPDTSIEVRGLVPRACSPTDMGQILLLVFAQVVPSEPGGHDGCCCGCRTSRVTVSAAPVARAPARTRSSPASDALDSEPIAGTSLAFGSVSSRERATGAGRCPGFGDPNARLADRRAGARRARRQPNRPALHRRLERELAVRGAAPLRVGEPAQRPPPRRRTDPHRLPHHRRGALRSARQSPDAGRAGPLPARTSRRRSGCSGACAWCSRWAGSDGRAGSGRQAGGSGCRPASGRVRPRAPRPRCPMACCW